MTTVFALDESYDDDDDDDDERRELCCDGVEKDVVSDDMTEGRAD